MANKTVYVFLASVLIILLGFGSFYLLKIRPMHEALATAQQNTVTYQNLTAANQRAYAKQKKKAKSDAAADKNMENADKVSASILPSHPEIENFLVTIQGQAEKYDVTLDTVSKGSAADAANGTASDSETASTASTSTAQSTSDGSDSTANSTSSSSGASSSSGSSSAAATTPQTMGSSSAVSALHTDNLAITMTAPNQANLTLFVRYLETLKRLLVITNYTMQASEQPVQTADASSSSSSSASDSSASASSESSDDASSTATTPIVQATMTLTIFSAK